MKTKRIKANVRVRTEAEVEVPPNVKVTKVVISHRLEGGKFVYDLTLPDGSKVRHRPKQLTEAVDNL